MHFSRHDFSEESQSELLDFLRTAETVNNIETDSNIWEKYLPKNETLKSELFNYQTNEVNRSVIDLTQSDELNDLKGIQEDFKEMMGIQENFREIILEESNTSNLTETVLNASSINDLVDAIKENLDTENYVPDDAIIKLILEYSEDQVRTIFNTFSEVLDKKSVYKLGNTVVMTKCSERNLFASYFAKYILIPKLFTENSKELEMMFSDFLNNFLNATSQEFSKYVQEFQNCPKSLADNLSILPDCYKQKLLRDLILNSTNLELVHFGLIDSLLTNDMESEIFQALIDLLIASGSTYSNDKSLGKLLLNLISNYDRIAVHFEQQLKHVVSTHTSVWKGIIQKALDNCVDNSMMFSQSLRY